MQNLTGIALMIAAMVGFAVTDTFVKFAALTLPVGQILFMLGLGGGIAFAVLTRVQGHAIFARDFYAKGVLLRNASEILGTVCFVTALSKIELSIASAIIQATPLAVTMGAALFLRETVGWRRWSAILVGFAGVFIILRPASTAFDPNTLWAVGGMLALSVRDLATRMIPPSMPTARAAGYGMSMLVPAGLTLMALGQTPQAMNAANSTYIAAAILLGVSGYYAITSAMRIGDIAVVAPFRYSRIIFALLIGVFVLGETIDVWTILGAAITIAAGLYTFLRERRLARAAARDPL